MSETSVVTPPERRMRATVLVVDDDESSRELVGRILRQRGCVVRLASNTEEAYGELASGTINVMLCDELMPDESGTEFLARLRAEYSNLPVVMVSGIANTNIAQVALELGACAYITKPFTAGQLIVAVANALHHGQLAREHRLVRGRLDTIGKTE